jgi:hypothetical protein
METPPLAAPPETPPDLAEDVFQLNCDHAKAGYANAQEVVRFVDSKTAILTGVVTVTTGIPFALFQFIISTETERAGRLLEIYRSCGPVTLALTLAPIGFGIMAGTLSLLSSTNGLMSRQPTAYGAKEGGMLRELLRFLGHKVHNLFGGPPRVTGHSGTLTSLFPLYPTWRANDATENFLSLARGEYSRRRILEEYASQLASIGSILDVKINRNRDAVRWFEIQALCYMVSASAAIAVFFCCLHPTKETKPLPPDAASISSPAPLSPQTPPKH